MHITVTKEMHELAGSLKKWGIDEEDIRWSGQSIDLRRYGNNSILELQAIFKRNPRAKGAQAALRDIAAWIEAATKGPKYVKCKNTKQFSSLVFEFLQDQPGNRLYCKDSDRDVWRAYYVGRITYYEKQVHRDCTTPAHTDMDLYYMELGKRRKMELSFRDDEVRGDTAREVLSNAGYIVETPDLKKEYDGYIDRYKEWYDKVGMQFYARGAGTDNLDGNNKNWGHKTFILDRDGEPSRLVVDIVQEEDDGRERDDKDFFDTSYWMDKSLLNAEHDDETLDEAGPDDSQADPPRPTVDVPIFPVVPTFDLKRHARLRVHVANMEPYVYDEKLGEKLVLPPETRDFVSLLVSDRSEFRDIVKGKGGGAVILCAGPAGCGKTLSAEVYSEVMRRPLYSVQCSQLGTDPDDLEKHLMLVLTRAQRWSAILLLDEADVYVAARGTDLVQNAIVGVFLRVLEYYSGVLFMTTNRSDMVDDAISSRCLARIDYQIPTAEDQAKIWHVLAKGAGIPLAEGLVADVVGCFPHLSGRDVKQLLKLASKVMRARGESEVTLEMVKFVKRFKPSPGGD